MTHQAESPGNRVLADGVTAARRDAGNFGVGW
jgi:hypothetical protein